MAQVQCSAQSWPQVLREEQWLLLPRILSQVCRGTGWLPTRGVEHRREQHRQHRTFGGPQQTLDVGSLPEQVLRLQRPSLRVEAEALGRRQKGGPESAPTLSCGR